MADDGGLTLNELGIARGISKDAAPRLVKAGKVAAHQPAGGHGPVTPTPGVRNDSATVADAPDLSVLAQVVDRLTVENRQLAEAAGVWQERARMLSDQPDPAAPQSLPGASEEPEPPEPTTKAEPRPDPFPAPLPPSPNATSWWRLRWVRVPWVLLAAIMLLALAVGQPTWVR